MSKAGQACLKGKNQCLMGSEVKAKGLRSQTDGSEVDFLPSMGKALSSCLSTTTNLTQPNSKYDSQAIYRISRENCGVM